eukprot:SAG25_NODE_101_length_15508_cov_11.653384_10_plen_184_part_00
MLYGVLMDRCATRGQAKGRGKATPPHHHDHPPRGTGNHCTYTRRVYIIYMCNGCHASGRSVSAQRTVAPVQLRVALDAPSGAGLGYDRDALLQRPAQQHLSRPHAVGGRGPHHRRVLHQRPAQRLQLGLALSEHSTAQEGERERESESESERASEAERRCGGQSPHAANINDIELNPPITTRC